MKYEGKLLFISALGRMSELLQLVTKYMHLQNAVRLVPNVNLSLQAEHMKDIDVCCIFVPI